MPTSEPDPVPASPATVLESSPDETVVAPVVRTSILEDGGLAPTPEHLRVGRAARMFWLWFPVNASLVVAALGAALLPTDGSLRQAILAALIGVALAFIPIGFGVMIAKRSGQSTMVASRAVFGHRGNILPALIALVTRVLLAGALVWFAALGIAGTLADDAGPTAAVRWLVLAGVLAVVVVAVALLGARVVMIVQLVPRSSPQCRSSGSWRSRSIVLILQVRCSVRMARGCPWSAAPCSCCRSLGSRGR